MPDDITRINSFGAAALLAALRRRFVEDLNIYTYVGDIVICLNPYMRLPKMVRNPSDSQLLLSHSQQPILLHHRRATVSVSFMLCWYPFTDTIILTCPPSYACGSVWSACFLFLTDSVF